MNEERFEHVEIQGHNVNMAMYGIACLKANIRMAWIRRGSRFWG